MQHSRDVPFRLLTSGHNQEMMPSSAAAVEFAGPRQVRVAAVALPEPGPDEVVVTTHFSGISGGTELLAYRGEIDPGVPLDDRIESLDGTFTYSFRYGYACVGEADGQPVFGTLNPQYDIVKLLRLYDAGKLKLDELVTRHYRLEDINQGYADLRAGTIIRGVILHES